jgi:hypothetical protein
MTMEFVPSFWEYKEFLDSAEEQEAYRRVRCARPRSGRTASG